MKPPKTLLMLLSIALLSALIFVLPAKAATLTFTFSNPGTITMPTSGPTAATPYPSTINVSGLDGVVQKVTVTLNGFSHSFPEDVDVLLVGPGGQYSMLMSDVSYGIDATNLNFTFDDAASGTLSCPGTTLTSGTYQPVNCPDEWGNDSFPAPAPTGPYNTSLAVFNNSDPNGDWKLYVFDDTNGDNGEFAGGWSLTLDLYTLEVAVEQASGQSDPTGSTPINFTATFGEPIDIPSFTSADVTLGGTVPGTLSAVVTEIAPNNGTTFNIAVSGMSGSGTVTAAIGAGKVQNIAGNINTASTSTDNEVTYDSTAPIIAATDLQTTYTTTGPNSFTVTFNKEIYNPAGNADTDDVTNPANYLLVEEGQNNTFDTTACNTGLQPDDTQTTVQSIGYNNTTFTATVTLASALPVGRYRLFVCGTTSIVDLAGNHLNDGSDHIVDFVVEASTTTTTTASSLPATGFRHGDVTQLPNQPAAKAYTATAMVLEIPKLGVSIPIVGVPQSGSEWDVTWLGNSAGYLYGSAFPTWAGNTVITGHVWDTYNQPGPFAELKTLKYGDQIQIQAWDQTYIYEVRQSKLVSTKNMDTVFQSEQYDWVTLMTCEFYNPFSGEYLFRRAVRAVLVNVQ